MKSPLICLLPVLAFALYPLERARAIAIEINYGFVNTEAQSAAGITSFDESGVYEQPVAASFSPLNGGLTLAASSWNLVNTATQFVWSNAPLLINLGAISGYESEASLYSQLRFSLAEPVNYSVTGSFLTALGSGAEAYSGVYLEKQSGPEHDYAWQGIYGETDYANGAGFSWLRFGDVQGVFKGASSGIIEPGKYSSPTRVPFSMAMAGSVLVSTLLP